MNKQSAVPSREEMAVIAVRPEIMRGTSFCSNSARLAFLQAENAKNVVNNPFVSVRKPKARHGSSIPAKQAPIPQSTATELKDLNELDQPATDHSQLDPEQVTPQAEAGHEAERASPEATKQMAAVAADTLGLTDAPPENKSGRPTSSMLDMLDSSPRAEDDYHTGSGPASHSSLDIVRMKDSTEAAADQSAAAIFGAVQQQDSGLIPADISSALTRRNMPEEPDSAWVERMLAESFEERTERQSKTQEDSEAPETKEMPDAIEKASGSPQSGPVWPVSARRMHWIEVGRSQETASMIHNCMFRGIP